MPCPWHILLRVIGRHALVVAGMLVVLLSPVLITCVPCTSTDAGVVGVTSHLVTNLPGDGFGDPADPDQCEHCHCTAPAAIVPDQIIRLPATLVSRNPVCLTPLRSPDDPSFAPDPPPNRA